MIVTSSLQVVHVSRGGFLKQKLRRFLGFARIYDPSRFYAYLVSIFSVGFLVSGNRHDL